MPNAAGDVAVATDIFDKATEADAIRDFRPLELPGVAEGEPIFRHFLLPAVDDYLLEQAEIVADAVAVSRNLQRRHAVHEAGGEPAEAAIAERGIRLFRNDLVEIDAELGK